MTRRATRQRESATAPIRYVIAARLRDAQNERGLKTEDLARETGISLRLVQKHRAGDNAPGDASLALYMRALRKPREFFFTGDPLERAA